MGPDPHKGRRRAAASATVRPLLACVLLLTLIGCSGAPRRAELVDGGVAIVAVTARDGIDVAINRSTLAREMGELIVERGGVPVVPAERVQRALGEKRYEALLRQYEADGQLSALHLQMLMAARLEAPAVLLSRIEENIVRSGPTVVQQLTDKAGRLLNDRERVILATERITRLSVVLVNLQTGAQYWQRNYEARPVSRSAYTHYKGSSFAGSLAASLANTVANGLRVPDRPQPPSLRLTLRALMRRVVNEMPGL